MEERNYNPAEELYRCSITHPDRIAVSCGEKSYTYGDLAMSAGKIASWIETFSLKRIIKVGILAGKNMDAVTGIMGTCWAGCIHITLDPGWTAGEIAGVIRLSGLNALITDENRIKMLHNEIFSVLPPSHILVPAIKGRETGSEKRFVGAEFLEMLRIPSRYPTFVLPEDIVSIMYSFGHTGTPQLKTVTAMEMASRLKSMQEGCPDPAEEELFQWGKLTFHDKLLPAILWPFLTIPIPERELTKQ